MSSFVCWRSGGASRRCRNFQVEYRYLKLLRLAIHPPEHPAPQTEHRLHNTRVHRLKLLHVVVQRELVWCGAKPDGVDFFAALVINPSFHEIAGEHIAGEQELVISLQRIEHVR